MLLLHDSWLSPGARFRKAQLLREAYWTQGREGDEVAAAVVASGMAAGLRDCLVWEARQDEAYGAALLCFVPEACEGAWPNVFEREKAEVDEDARVAVALNRLETVVAPVGMPDPLNAEFARVCDQLPPKAACVALWTKDPAGLPALLRLARAVTLKLSV